MDESFDRFGGISAILVGVLAIVYAIFYLVIAKQAEYVGTVGSWIILAASGVFVGAAYVALYRRVRGSGEGFALWALFLGMAQSLGTLLNGAYQALLVSSMGAGEAVSAARSVPSPVDPKGLATFLIFALASFVFGWLITRGHTLPRTLGYVGMFNALLLVVLFFANVAGNLTLILASGGLSSVIVTPLWWIWLGSRLMRAEGTSRQSVPADEMPMGHAAARP